MTFFLVFFLAVASGCGPHTDEYRGRGKMQVGLKTRLTSGSVSLEPQADPGDPEFYLFPNRCNLSTLPTEQVNQVYVDGNAIYAGTYGGLGISKDGGATWTFKTTADGLSSNRIDSVYATGRNIYAATLYGLSISNDGGETWTVKKENENGLGEGFVNRVVGADGIIYAATFGGLSISKDGGMTWMTRTSADGLIYNVIDDLQIVGHTIYAATSNGLAISTDGGKSWSNKTKENGLGGNRVTSVYVSGSAIYAATDGILSISADGGASWTTQTIPSRNNHYDKENIESVRGESGALYLGLNQYSKLRDKRGSFAVSYDGGTTWSVRIGGNTPNSNIYGISDLHVAGNILYAATGKGIVLSTDKGISWNKLHRERFDTNVQHVFGTNTYIFVATDRGLSLSGDGGETCKTLTTEQGLSDNIIYHTFPKVRSTLLVSTAHGLSISKDLGQTWSTKTTLDGLADNLIRATYSEGPSIFVATNGGLSLSHDNGSTWTTKTVTDGLGHNQINHVNVVRKMIFAATRGGLSLSTDEGATWTTRTTANGLGHNNVNQTYILGNTIYAATDGGLSISKDDGTVWVNKTMANGLASNKVTGIYAMDIRGAYPPGHSIYAATDQGLSVSRDGGVTWFNLTTANGLADNQVNAVSVAEDVIYAATARGLSISKDHRLLTRQDDSGRLITNGTDWLSLRATDGSKILVSGRFAVSMGGFHGRASGIFEYFRIETPDSDPSSQIRLTLRVRPQHNLSQVEHTEDVELVYSSVKKAYFTPHGWKSGTMYERKILGEAGNFYYNVTLSITKNGDLLHDPQSGSTEFLLNSIFR
jgi:hypothetical protein